MHIIVASGLLFVAGFFFPPAWLALAGYVFYVAKTAKSRRDKIVERFLLKMADVGQEKTTIPTLHFEAACGYAKDRGGTIFDEDREVISTTIPLRGGRYSVTFLKDAHMGGTYVTLVRY